jgi:DNA-binding NtrC family response regulator
MPRPARILVVDRDSPPVTTMSQLLAAAGHETVHATHVDDALARLADVDLVLVGIHHGCVEDVGRLAGSPVAPPIVALVADASAASTVRDARRHGATDALHGADGVDALLLAVERAIETGRLRREVAMLRARVGDRVAESLVGRSAAIVGVRELIGRAAASRTTVLVSGEAGTGKDVVARLVHDLSDRADRPCITLRCAAGADSAVLERELFGDADGAGGLVDRARGGSLVLDEIAGLAPAARERLAIVLRSEVRLIVMTREALPPGAMGRGGTLPIALPPLRERRSDIPLLVHHFRARVAREIGAAALPPLAPEAMMALIGEQWPGNVHRPDIGASTTVATMYDDGATLEELERRYILHVLQREQGHQSRAADRLGIDRRTLYRKLKQYRDEGVGSIP